MKVIVHVGSPKTGTSSLQQFLYSKREELKAVGVVYPDFGFRAHTLLSAAFSGGIGAGERLRRRIEAKKNSMAIDGFKDYFRDLLTGFRDELLILSNEGLSRQPRAGNLVPFIESVRPDAEIMVLDYVREPVAHFPSATQQNLKLEGDHTLYPANWLSPHCARGDYLLKDIKSEQLIFRIFSPTTLVNGDVIDDFGAFVKRRTGIELPVNVDQAARNVSLSAPACGMLALIDLVADRPFPSEQRNAYTSQLREADTALEPEKLKLPDDFRQAIVANNHEAWNSLLAVCDHDEATRASMKLPTATLPEGIEEASSGVWAAKSLTKDYVMAFLRAARGNLKPRDSKQIVPWLMHALQSTKTLHGVTIERADIAELKEAVELGSNRSKTARGSSPRAQDRRELDGPASAATDTASLPASIAPASSP